MFFFATYIYIYILLQDSILAHFVHFVHSPHKKRPILAAELAENTPSCKKRSRLVPKKRMVFCEKTQNLTSICLKCAKDQSCWIHRPSISTQVWDLPRKASSGGPFKCSWPGKKTHGATGNINSYLLKWGLPRPQLKSGDRCGQAQSISKQPPENMV